MASNVPRSTICFDKENPSTQIHKIKDASSKRFQKGSKRVRTVLGSVSNFSNVRVQPSRAVKVSFLFVWGFRLNACVSKVLLI